MKEQLSSSFTLSVTRLFYRIGLKHVILANSCCPNLITSLQNHMPHTKRDMISLSCVYKLDYPSQLGFQAMSFIALYEIPVCPKNKQKCVYSTILHNHAHNKVSMCGTAWTEEGSHAI